MLCAIQQDAVWQGQVAGVEAALDFFKADKAFPLSQMHKVDKFGLIIVVRLICFPYHHVICLTNYKNVNSKFKQDVSYLF